MQKPTLVLFDFDGTLTKSASLPRFLLFAVPLPELLKGSIILCFKFLKLIWSGAWTNEKGKELLLSQFFKGQPFDALNALGVAFCHKKLPLMLRTELVDQLRTYRNSGAEVALVSASADVWLRPFCVAENIRLLCTEMQFESGVFTGQLATANCNGHEKAKRIQAVYELSGFQNIIAFGNSTGDAAMLALANEAWLLQDGVLKRL